MNERDSTWLISPYFSTLKRDKVGYKEILAHIEAAVQSGKVTAGYRLPPQRALALEIGVSVGTVTRAYVEAERRGIVSAQVGRGTFVTGALPGRATGNAHDSLESEIDFTHNRLPVEGYAREFFRTLNELSKSANAATLLNLPEASIFRFQAIAADWIHRTGLSVSPEQVVICSGVQHGLATILGALAQPGDIVLTEWLNYPGIRLLEQIYHVQMQSLPLDDDGIRLDALEATCKRRKARFLLCQPTVHNPTSTVTSQKRRQALASIIEQYNLILIEDDIYGFLPSEPAMPISSYVPDRSFYITGTSKTIGTGIRVGYIVAPLPFIHHLNAAAHATAWTMSPFMPEIVSKWILDGTAGAIINWHRREARIRQEIAKACLDTFNYKTHPSAYHIWLNLPDIWSQHAFVRECRHNGLRVNSSEIFVIGDNQPPRAVRICLGLQDHATLARGLKLIHDILVAGPRFDPLSA